MVMSLVMGVVVPLFSLLRPNRAVVGAGYEQRSRGRRIAMVRSSLRPRDDSAVFLFVVVILLLILTVGWLH